MYDLTREHLVDPDHNDSDCDPGTYDAVRGALLRGDVATLRWIRARFGLDPRRYDKCADYSSDLCDAGDEALPAIEWLFDEYGGAIDTDGMLERALESNAPRVVAWLFARLRPSRQEVVRAIEGAGWHPAGEQHSYIRARTVLQLAAAAGLRRDELPAAALLRAPLGYYARLWPVWRSQLGTEELVLQGDLELEAVVEETWEAVRHLRARAADLDPEVTRIMNHYALRRGHVTRARWLLDAPAAPAGCPIPEKFGGQCRACGEREAGLAALRRPAKKRRRELGDT
jgi:hypothetical protein